MSQPQADTLVGRHGSKRRRINTARQPADDNEASSSGSGSGSDLEGPSRTTLKETDGVDANDVEDTSSSGSSSEDDLNTDPASTTPHDSTKPTPASTDIHNRLTSFFSQLAEQRAKPDTAADENIEEGSSDSGYGDDDEGKQYIELDLALGVLSEDPDGVDGGEVKLPRGQKEGDLSDDGEDEGQEEGRGRGTDVLQNLTSVADGGGRKSRRGGKKRAVEEVG